MRDFKARHGDTTSSGGGGGASTPTSVPKKASSARKRATTAKGRKKKAVVSEEGDDDDDDTLADSPLAKKVKRMHEDEEKDVKPSDLGDRKRERRYVSHLFLPGHTRQRLTCSQCYCCQP